MGRRTHVFFGNLGSAIECLEANKLASQAIDTTINRFRHFRDDRTTSRNGGGCRMKTWMTALVSAVAFLALASVAGATAITISGSMEGNLLVSPGNNVRAGFDFAMPGEHPSANVNITGSVTIFYTCSNNSSGSFVIPVGGSYSDPKNNNSWFPSGSQSSPSVYQGSTSAPNVCRGHSYHAPRATFAANVTSNDDDDPILVRFHYSDNSAGSWSDTVRVKASSKSDRD